MASVYVHFPYCLTKCPYCDFVSYGVKSDNIPHHAYADAVVMELEQRVQALWSEGWDATIDSLFFGGGTPSLWAPEALGRVIQAVWERLPCSPSLEVTVECNPTSLDRTRAARLVSWGVNRLSIGVQSLRSEALLFLGRLHDPDLALQSVDAALGSGARVSADLIFGLPEQTPEEACAEAEALCSRGLKHLSCYQLTIEPGTQFGELAKRGRLPLADEGFVADSFLALHEALPAAGLAHYEISNYAIPGEEARHNLNYWHGADYLGLGCGAYGRIQTGLSSAFRYRNEIDPLRYRQKAMAMQSHRPGEDDGLSLSIEQLPSETLLRERIMLGLRLATGFDLTQSAAQLGLDPWTESRTQTVERLVARGRLERDGDRLRISPAAWLWTDDTAAQLF